MAYITADIKIPEIERTITTQLYFPTDLPEEIGNKVKGVITLLHGVSNTGNDWMMMSAATRYAADNGYLLIAPLADNSFYADMRYGAPFYTIITEYLPAQLDAIFHIPRARELNYIAGLSMGGYGAMLIGLRYPERYAAIGSFSGVLDIRFIAGLPETQGTANVVMSMKSAFGEERQVPDDMDLVLLSRQVAVLPAAQQPRLFATMGKGDTWLETTHNFRDAIRGLPLDATFMEWDGVHEWNFWDRSLAEFIGFVQNSDYAQRKRQDWGSEADVIRL